MTPLAEMPFSALHFVSMLCSHATAVRASMVGLVLPPVMMVTKESLYAAENGKPHGMPKREQQW